LARLDGRVAIITGAASGIGRAAAHLFAADGASVLAIDVVASAEPFDSDRIRLFRADIADEAAPEAIAREVERQFGRLDVLFNNAGVSKPGSLAELSDADWDWMQNINLRAAFRLTRACAPLLKRSPAGRIIATASAGVRLSSGNMGAYEVSKAGLAVLMRAFAADLGRFGVTANAIMPGPTRTPMIEARLRDPAHAETWAAHTFLRRIGEPEEIARVALFLASDESSSITGQAIAADGGFASSV